MLNRLLPIGFGLLLTLTSFAQKQRITVAQDGRGDYKTVQAALSSVPSNNRNRITIFIRNGIYSEKLKLDSTQHFVTLIGESNASTILTWDDYSGKTRADGSKLRTSTSGSFAIFSNDFRAENLTFQNRAGPVGQAVAAFVTGDRAVFINCRFLGNQDTLYTGMPTQPEPHRQTDSRQYYKNCYIEGTTDFIFGSATVLFDQCTLFSKAGGHYITAAATPEGKPFGYVFLNCILTGDAPDASVYLGRPWREWAKTVFINCRMAAHIKPEGWHNWDKPNAEKTAFYADYNSTGLGSIPPGASPIGRVIWSKQLTVTEAKQYTLETVFPGNRAWLSAAGPNGLTGVRDTSFTVHSAYEKARKTHPAIQLVEPALPPGVTAKTNIAYCQQNGRDLYLDVFYPTKTNSTRRWATLRPAWIRRAVLLIHGGGWRSGDRAQQIPMAQQLAANGYVAVTAEYRLSTEALYPAAVHDLKAAVRWLRANAGQFDIDTLKIAALGCSAGGQLAALLGTTGQLTTLEGSTNCSLGHSSAVQAVVDVDGLLAFDHPESGEGDDSRSTSAATYWFGGPKAETRALWHEASPLTHADKNTAPILFLNSSVDRMHAGRDDLSRKLDALGIYSERHTFADAPHPFWLFHPWFEPTIRYTLAFLGKVFAK